MNNWANFSSQEGIFYLQRAVLESSADVNPCFCVNFHCYFFAGTCGFFSGVGFWKKKNHILLIYVMLYL